MICRPLRILALSTLTISTSAQITDQARGEVTDTAITTAIESELWADDLVPADSVDVSTRNGIVMLEGSVGHLLAIDRLQAIAEATVGVRGVVDRVKVETPPRSDATVAAAVEAALFADPATDAYEVEAEVDRGLVTLSGTVDSWQEKQLCTHVVRSVRGVRKVVNKIAVAYAAERPNLEIEPEIEQRLAYDVGVDADLIDVAVRDGHVTLTGVVGSLAEKRRAIADAWVAGVRSVRGNDLHVQWWSRNRLRRDPDAARPADPDLERAVKDALRYDPRCPTPTPSVTVRDGVATLRGIVGDLKGKQAAEADARNVFGIRRVRNHLKVRPENPPTNAELEKRVAQALVADPLVNRFDLDIEATGGWVFLSGRVNTGVEKNRAEWVAEGVPGVVGVSNSVEAASKWRWKPDREIRDEIENHLFWSPFVDAERVAVRVEAGVATLSGRVSTWSERAAAEKNALEGGARHVQNLLQVEHDYYGPYPGWAGHWELPPSPHDEDSEDQ